MSINQYLEMLNEVVKGLVEQLTGQEPIQLPLPGCWEPSQVAAAQCALDTLEMAARTLLGFIMALRALLNTVAPVKTSESSSNIG